MALQKFPGDFDVMRYSRRLQLALMPDGWRGNVERQIEAEMKNREEEDDYLQGKISAGKSLGPNDFVTSRDQNKDTKYNFHNESDIEEKPYYERAEEKYTMNISEASTFLE